MFLLKAYVITFSGVGLRQFAIMMYILIELETTMAGTTTYVGN